MKSILLSILWACYLFLMATTSSLCAQQNINVEDGINRIDARLQLLEATEQLIISSELSYDELLVLQPSLQETLSSKNDKGILDSEGNPKNVGLVGFLLGVGCGALGVLAVLLIFKDKERRNKEAIAASIGCLLTTLVYILLSGY